MSMENDPFKAYAKGRDAQEGKRAEEVDTRPTLTAILAQESRQFGAMLESYDDDDDKRDLAKRMLKKELDPNDASELAKLREEYLKRKEAGIRLEESMDDAHIEELARYSPEFDKLRTVVGVQRLHEIIRAGIIDKAIADPEEFQTLLKKQERLMVVEERAKVANERVRGLCRRYKLSSPRLIVDALAIENDDDRTEALREAFRSEMSFIGKLFDRWGKDSLDDAVNTSLYTAAEFETLRKERAAVMQESGEFIAHLASDDEGMRESLTQALFGEKVGGNKEKHASLKDVTGKIPTDEEVRSAWATYKDEKGLTNDWGALLGHEQADARGDFRRKFEEKRPPIGGGFWATIAGIFFGSDELFREENLQ